MEYRRPGDPGVRMVIHLRAPDYRSRKGIHRVDDALQVAEVGQMAGRPFTSDTTDADRGPHFARRLEGPQDTS